MSGNPAAGLLYLWRGFQLLRRPGLRRYVAVPLLLNILIFGLLLGSGVSGFNRGLQWLLELLPGWLDFLQWLLWPLAVILLLIAAAFISSALANLIAAPFNGLLAERVEALLTGQPPRDDSPWDTLRDTPRALGKELRKIGYYLPRVALILLCSFIPLLNLAAPLLWFLFGAWLMAVQYCDYPMDNHRHTLAEVRRRLGRERLTSLGFGAGAMLAAMVPLLNFVIMPAAVCGATLYWVERLRTADIAAGKE